ncbi:MAG: transketolase C-terminal domain-containing protein [Actinomycetota bacterium]
MNKIMEDSQKAIILELQDIMTENKDVFFVLADVGLLFKFGFGVDAMPHPERVIDVGVAEQNMVGFASGLAYSGKTVFTSTIAEMQTARVTEQIRLDACYPNLNINMLGLGRGLVFAQGGVTHTSPEDIAMLRGIPDITIILSADTLEVRKIVRAAVKTPGAKYIGIPRGKVPRVYESDYDYQIGKAIILKEGKDITLIATGDMVAKTLDAAVLLDKESGIKAKVINMHTVKPIDEEAIIKAAKETGAIVTIEDHNIIGGLGGAVAEVLGEKCPTLMKRIGVPDTFTIIGESWDSILHTYKMDTIDIVAASKDLLGR